MMWFGSSIDIRKGGLETDVAPFRKLYWQRHGLNLILSVSVDVIL